MKIAVSAAGGSMASPVEQRFGRCAYFLIVDSDTGRFEAFSNPATVLPSGAGPATVQELVQRGADVVLTGSVGPNAQGALGQTSIEVVTGVSGTVRQAVDTYLEQKR